MLSPPKKVGVADFTFQSPWALQALGL